MGRPLIPKPPNPRIRDPSVTAAIRASEDKGHCNKISLIWPLCSIDTYIPSGVGAQYDSGIQSGNHFLFKNRPFKHYFKHTFNKRRTIMSANKSHKTNQVRGLSAHWDKYSALTTQSLSTLVGRGICPYELVNWNEVDATLSPIGVRTAKSQAARGCNELQKAEHQTKLAKFRITPWISRLCNLW